MHPVNIAVLQAMHDDPDHPIEPIDRGAVVWTIIFVAIVSFTMGVASTYLFLR